jgi:Response regulator containing a CheY-like receiver domain and an HTH DNA-binding domain
MKILIFIENVILIILYSSVAVMCYQYYKKYKEKIVNYIMGVFLFFILDEFIVFAAEFLTYDNMKGRLIQSVITYPIVKIIAAAGICLFYVLVFWTLLERDIRWYHMFPVLFVITVSIVCSCIRQTPWVIWFFYSIRQFVGIYFVLQYFYILYTTRDKEYCLRLQKHRIFFSGALFFLISIFWEDTVVIHQLYHLLTMIPWLNEKNVCEDIFSVFIAWEAIRYIYRLELERLKSANGEREHTEKMKSLSTKERIRLFCEKFKLTNRESEILYFLLEGKTNQEISEVLYITVGTVKTHVHKIFEKVNVTRRSQLIQQFEKDSEL